MNSQLAGNAQHLAWNLVLCVGSAPVDSAKHGGVLQINGRIYKQGGVIYHARETFSLDPYFRDLRGNLCLGGQAVILSVYNVTCIQLVTVKKYKYWAWM